MTELDAFLGAMHLNPDDITTKLAFADWMDEHPDAIPCQQDRWTQLFRAWNGKTIGICDMVIRVQDQKLLDCVLIGSKEKHIINSKLCDLHFDFAGGQAVSSEFTGCSIVLEGGWINAVNCAFISCTMWYRSGAALPDPPPVGRSAIHHNTYYRTPEYHPGLYESRSNRTNLIGQGLLTAPLRRPRTQ